MRLAQLGPLPPPAHHDDENEYRDATTDNVMRVFVKRGQIECNKVAEHGTIGGDGMDRSLGFGTVGNGRIKLAHASESRTKIASGFRSPSQTVPLMGWVGAVRGYGEALGCDPVSGRISGAETHSARACRVSCDALRYRRGFY